jgi:phage shock protein A
VKEENLRKSVENCTSSHKQFENKMSQFKQTFGDVKGRVENLLTAGPFLATKNLEQAIKEHHRHINEQKSIMQSLRLVFSYFSVFNVFFNVKEAFNVNALS